MNSCRLRLRPMYSLADASMPEQRIAVSKIQNREVSPRIFNNVKMATAAPLAVRWALIFAIRSDARQNSSHKKPAIAIFLNIASWGAFIIVMAHNI